MKPLRPITLTHANLKVPVEISREQIFAYYMSPGHKSTFLLATGGAMLPVVETPEQIKSLLQVHVPVSETPEEIINKNNGEKTNNG